jgi:uncharacterized protein DUF4157
VRLLERTPQTQAAPGARRVDHRPAFPVRPSEILPRLGPGRAVEPALERDLAGTFGHDFSRVRIHDDGEADHVARILGAEAFAAGPHIGFRSGRFRPETHPGRALLEHEAAHVAGAARDSAVHPVQLAVAVGDVTEEMVGQTFILREKAGSAPDEIPKGARVIVKAWGKTEKATVEHTKGAKTISAEVFKVDLDPEVVVTAGVRRYEVGLADQAKAVTAAKKKSDEAWGELAEWKMKESAYTKNRKFWEDAVKDAEAEVLNRDKILKDKGAVYAEMLVLETMYNRFDPLIVKWIDHYHASLGTKTKPDPNIVKSMMFQESRMGTHGEHLELPPYSWSDEDKNPIRSRFNLLQAVDSPGEQQLLMMEEMAPAIYKKYKLDELAKEHKRKGKTDAEFYAWRSGDFGKALVEFHADRTGGKNLMGTPGKDLYEDYEFWIRTGIRWLYYKFLSLPESKRGWEEAVRAYNGSGPGAKAYKKKVMSRVGSTKSLSVGMD